MPTLHYTDAPQFTGWGTRSRSHSHSEGNYWLLDAAEIQRLPLTKVIVKLRNCLFPILGKRLDHRKAWRWRGQWYRWEASLKGVHTGAVCARWM